MKVEFYRDHSGTVLPKLYIKFENTIFDDIKKLDDLQIEALFNRVMQEPVAKRALILLAKHYPNDRRTILETFCLCNWSSLDGRWDISNKTLQFERVHCEFKNNGQCPFSGCGIICQKV